MFGMCVQCQVQMLSFHHVHEMSLVLSNILCLNIRSEESRVETAILEPGNCVSYVSFFK